MSISVVCDACGKKLKAPDRYEGKKGKCPTCGASIVVSRQKAAEGEGADPGGAKAEAAQKAQPAAAAQATSTTSQEGATDKTLKILQVEGFSDINIVRFAASRVLDGSNVEQLGEEFQYLIKERYMVKMVVNFEKVKYMSSAVLGKLITLNKLIAAEKGKLKFCGIDQNVLEIFKIMKLDKLFKIYDTEEKAVESFNKWFG